MKLIIAAFIASLFVNAPGVKVEKWVIEKNSNLRIEGQSNVNRFRCDVTAYFPADTLFFYKEQPQLFTIKGGLTIQVNNFDCHQRYITADLRKTLKANESPVLRIDLLSIGTFTGVGEERTKGCVAIQLAGVTRKMEVDYTVQSVGNGILRLCGSRQILLADFHLKPPRKLAGMIKVNDQIDVHFELNLRLVQNDMWGKR